MVALWSNLHIECVFGVSLDRPLRARGARAAVGAHAAGRRPRADDRRGRDGRAAGEPLWVGTLPVPLRERVGPPDSQHRRAAASLSADLSRVLRLRRRRRSCSCCRCLAGSRCGKRSTLVVFAALGFRFLRLTPLVFLATAPMLASRLTVWTTRGLDGRAVLATALAAAVFLSRVPLTTMVGGMRVGGAHPDVVFSAQALAFARARGPERPRLQQPQPRRVAGLDDVPGGAGVSGQPAPGISAGTLSRHPRRVAIAAGVGRARVRRRLGHSVRAPAERAVRRRPLSDSAWATVYEDEAVEILVRRSGRYAALAGR